MKNINKYNTLYVTILFVFIALFFTFPIAFHLDSLVIGRPFDDVFESIWYLDWYEHALLDLSTSPFFQSDIFYPAGWDLRLSIFPPVYPVLLSPFTALWGPVVVYNLALILSCVIAALGSYHLARSIGASICGGILAGIGFAFYPNREVYLSGFLNFLLGSMWMPWMLYAVIQAIQKPESRTIWMIVVGATFALSVAGAWPLAFISGGLLLCFGILYLMPKISTDWKNWISPLLLGLFVASIIVVPLILTAYMARRNLGSAAEFALHTHVDPTSVSLERLFVPSALNPLTWDLARNIFPLRNGEDGVVYFGYTIVILALFTFFRNSKDLIVRALMIISFIGIVLMLGTTLHVMGKSILIGGSLADLLTEILPVVSTTTGKSAIPLPSLFIYLGVPFFRSFHHFGRWGLMTSVCLSALAGVGLTNICDRFWYKRKINLSIGCILLLLLEFNTQPLTAITSIKEMERGVDVWLSAQSKQGVIIEYPLHYTMSAQTLYYTLFHKQRIVHGYSSILPREFSDKRSLIEEWPSEGTIDYLEKLGVDYVLINVFDETEFMNNELVQLFENKRLNLVHKFSESVGPVRDIYLFEIVY